MDGRRGALPGHGRAAASTATSRAARQNEIYELRRGDAALRHAHPATRRAPATRDEGIVREWRIIEALDGTDVPHTEAIAVCDGRSRVLGRTVRPDGLRRRLAVRWTGVRQVGRGRSRVILTCGWGLSLITWPRASLCWSKVDSAV